MIDHLLRKYKADQKWTHIVIEQLSEEDISWSPTPESNSITNLIAHISGAARYWFDAAYFGAPLNEYRSIEFERGLQIAYLTIPVSNLKNSVKWNGEYFGLNK
ncbi:DUF1572 family protein [Paenibacillus sp. 2RAB27]|uniref:DUF1572 family protein n=1 Tax=Paenibacillus sp. 2RAB27 TaxID=3232991 RepID=UPI003F99F1A9